MWHIFSPIVYSTVLPLSCGMQKKKNYMTWDTKVTLALLLGAVFYNLLPVISKM